MNAATLPIIGFIGLMMLGGGFGVFELVYKRKRSPRGGLRWLFLIFVIDGAVAIVAYIFLDAAAVHDFWGGPIVIYLVAVVWSTFLLRMQFEFLVPGGQHAQDFFHILPASREYLAQRVSIASESWRITWVDERVVPGVTTYGFTKFAARASRFLGELDLIDEDQREELVERVREIEQDNKSTRDSRISTIALLLMKNHGLSEVKTVALSWREARAHKRSRKAKAKARAAARRTSSAAAKRARTKGHTSASAAGEPSGAVGDGD